MTKSCCLHDPESRNWLIARVYDRTETLEVQLAAAAVLLSDPAIAPVPKEQLRGPTSADLETLLRRIRRKLLRESGRTDATASVARAFGAALAPAPLAHTVFQRAGRTGLFFRIREGFSGRSASSQMPAVHR